MTDIAQAFRAGIDAVFADNGLNANGFSDALQTVLTQNFNNSEANDWRDAIATEYNRLGLCNNPTYASLRNQGILGAADADQAEALFTALSSVFQLPETRPAIQSARLIDLREDRDEINNAIDRLNVLIAAEPNGAVGRLVKETMRQGKDSLRNRKEEVRNEIKTIIGDPDG